MKIARVQVGGTVAHAVVEGDELRLIEGDLFGEWKITDQLLSRPQAKFLAPVDPPQVVAIGLNYRAHASEGNEDVPDAPLIFIKTHNAIVGPGEPILLPKMAPSEVDYEAELVLVIGTRAKNVARDRAMDYVLGYTCGNDVSARDCQLRFDKQWARGKCFDTFAPIGPWIETELDCDDLAIRSVLNGQVMQDSRTSKMMFPPAELVWYVSQCMTLQPGSIIMTGTPSGVGFSRTPPVFLNDGDEITIEIEGIGELTNPVAMEA